MRSEKFHIGATLRNIREEHNLTQAQFAKQLGISTSYLNQMENNQRHVTATVLFALAKTFSVDIASLTNSDSERLFADIVEALADPLFEGETPSVRELKMFSQNTPSVARAFLAMHAALRDTGRRLVHLDDTLSRSGAIAEPTPYDEIRDYFHYRDNYVHALDVAAEDLHALISRESHSLTHALAEYIESKHKIRVVVARPRSDQKSLREFDPAARVLTLNPTSAPASQAFQIAYQIAEIEHAALIKQIIAAADFRSDEAGDVCRIGLANYFAGAALMPYGRFAQKARELRHDVELLADHFSVSLDQVSHRLSTLQRPGANGLPFFFARVDQAGNITKRHSAAKLQFARYGSTCPLWCVHRAFETPGRIIRQLAETPDGVRYICLGIALNKRSGGFRDPVRRYALALGCEIKHVADICYGDDLDIENPEAYEPIGVSCRICDRANCQQRAAPPFKRKLKIDHNSRGNIPYSIL